MSLAQLREAVRAEIQNGPAKADRKAERQLSPSERQALRAARRRIRAASNTNGKQFGAEAWWW
jgi:hypothetical protein